MQKTIPILRKIKYIYISVLFLSFGFFIFFLSDFYLTDLSPLNMSEDLVINIQSKITASKAIDELENTLPRKFKYKRVLKFITKISGLDIQIKSGFHSINKELNAVQAIFALTEQQQEPLQALMIPPGYSAKKIAYLINSSKFFSGQNITPPIEGSVLSDTYFFPIGFERKKAIQSLIETTKKRATLIWMINKEKNPYLKSLSEAMTMASIIEKEKAQFDNPAEISGVFVNRLKLGMRLQSDATTLYAVYLKTGIWKNVLSIQDLRIQSPFNTYISKGLPPSPISSPSESSLLAAFNYAEHDKLFFISGKDGVSRFSKTFAEHVKYKNILSPKKHKKLNNN